MGGKLGAKLFCALCGIFIEAFRGVKVVPLMCKLSCTVQIMFMKSTKLRGLGVSNGIRWSKSNRDSDIVVPIQSNWDSDNKFGHDFRFKYTFLIKSTYFQLFNQKSVNQCGILGN